MGCVLLIGTLDTKGDALACARDLIVARGHEALLLDVGVLGDATVAADIRAEEAAAAGGTPLAELRACRDQELAISTMRAGARHITSTLYAQNRFAGVLSVGGTAGTTIGTAAMRVLPVGVPKVVVSDVASGETARFVDIKDVTMMFSVIDLDSLNAVSRRMLANAVGAICGMIEQPAPAAVEKPLLAATMFGVTTPCVTAVRTRLEAAGFDVVVFHANGTGGRALEALIDDGYFTGVADVTTTEWCDEVVGGMRSAGPDRLGAAARAGIPQVVSVGALDMVNFLGPQTVPETWRATRTLYRHNPNATLMRTTAAECAEIGRRIAEKLNLATGPTVLLIPLRGVSMMDAPGQPFYDPVADAALFDALRVHCGQGVRIVEVDAHINDVVFAHRVAAELLALLQADVRKTAGG